MRRLVIAAIAAALIFAGCSTAGSSPTLAPNQTPTSTVGAATTTAPAPTATPTPEGSPSSSPAPTIASTPTPYPTGAPGAEAFVKAYENALIAGDYTTAWSMLAPAATSAWGTLSKYTGDRTAFMASAGKVYTTVANPPATLSITEWLKGTPFVGSVDKAKAVLVQVNWAALAKNNAGWEMWVVNPTATGWELYEVR